MVKMITYVVEKCLGYHKREPEEGTHKVVIDNLTEDGQQTQMSNL